MLSARARVRQLNKTLQEAFSKPLSWNSWLLNCSQLSWRIALLRILGWRSLRALRDFARWNLRLRCLHLRCLRLRRLRRLVCPLGRLSWFLDAVCLLRRSLLLLLTVLAAFVMAALVMSTEMAERALEPGKARNVWHMMPAGPTMRNVRPTMRNVRTWARTMTMMRFMMRALMGTAVRTVMVAIERVRPMLS